MKKVFTLARTLAAAVLLLVVVNASAANTSDDNGKCKKDCCKKQQAITTTTEETVKAFTEALLSIATEIKTLTGVNAMPVRIVRNGNSFVIIDTDEEANTNKQEQKINFKNLDKEMDLVQEDMSQMDITLKKDDTQARKAGEEILKTGIKQ